MMPNPQWIKPRDTVHIRGACGFERCRDRDTWCVMGVVQTISAADDFGSWCSVDVWTNHRGPVELHTVRMSFDDLLKAPIADYRIRRPHVRFNTRGLRYLSAKWIEDHEPKEAHR